MGVRAACCAHQLTINSIPPERVFSILNDTFDDDQTRSLADYIQLSLQKQYNARGRKSSTVLESEKESEKE